MRKLFPLVLFIPSFSWGAIAFDAASQFSHTTAIFKNSAPWTVTWNHTCTGSNLALLVGVTVQGSASAQYVLGITYNGVAMNILNRTPAATTDSELWYLAGPATGSNAIIITFISTATSLGGMAGAESFTGVNQTTTVDVSTAGAQASATTISLSATTTVNNDWGVDVVYIFNTSSLTSTNGTAEWGFVDSGDVANSTSSIRGPLTPAGSFSMGYTFGSASASKYVIGFIEPAPAATGGAKSKMMDILRREE